MTINIPAKVRTILYILTVLTAPLMAYLQITEVIGTNEINLYLAYVTAIAAMAGFNVPAK